MPFHSILFETLDDRDVPSATDWGDALSDLNLDQIVEGVIEGKEAYDLQAFFLEPLKSVRAIEYRQAVMRDLEAEKTMRVINRFAGDMRAMRGNLTLSEKLYYRLQKEAWFLHAVEVYCEAVRQLATDLKSAALTSTGLKSFAEYLDTYIEADEFTGLQAELSQVKLELADVQYALTVRGNRVTVRRYAEEPDYSAEVVQTFEKFRQGQAKSYLVEFSEAKEMNHIEAQVLELVAKLHQVAFSDLHRFVVDHQGFADDRITAFDREVQFYCAYLQYIEELRRNGLHFCYPHVVENPVQIWAEETFDLALAHKLHRHDTEVICNDFRLDDPERILVVTGPNQGGKTTLARTFGQLHYLARLGCPVPGTGVQVLLFDQLFTLFERIEEVQNLRGKLKDDLVRIRQALERASSRSVIILNEAFTSTTAKDADLLSRKIMKEVSDLDCLSVWVTFIDSLSTFREKTISMVSSVDPENPARRTFKINRSPADGLAYAMAIAKKHQLTYHDLEERLVL